MKRDKILQEAKSYGMQGFGQLENTTVSELVKVFLATLDHKETNKLNKMLNKVEDYSRSALLGNLGDLLDSHIKEVSEKTGVSEDTVRQKIMSIYTVHILLNLV